MFHYFFVNLFLPLGVHKCQYKYEIRNFLSSVRATQSGAVIYLRAHRSCVQHSGTTCYNMKTTVHLRTQCNYVPRISLSVSSDYSLYKINQWVFILDIECFLCHE